MLEQRKGYFAALLYAVIIGFSFLFVKIALNFASPLDVLAHRFTIAFLVATIPILLKKVKLDIVMKDVLKILPLALLYPALFFLFQAFGLVYTSSSEAGIINATVPIFTMILASLLLKEHSSSLQKVFIFLSVSGVIYISMMNGQTMNGFNIKGILFILFSALSASLYNIFARSLTRKYSLFMLTYMMTLLGFIAFNTTAISVHMMNNSLSDFFLPFLNLKFLMPILYLGILSSLLTAYLSNYALSKIEATKMSIFSNLATLITIMAGVIFLNEKMQTYHLVGAILILVGVIGTTFSMNSKH